MLYVSDPPGLDRDGRRRSLDALKELNERHYEKAQDPETLSRIAQYELAFRMQLSVPEVMDISQEDETTLRDYGADPGSSSFANNCLLARRLTERGVRFVQLFDWGWDTHGTSPGDDIVHQLPLKCRQTDRPVAALIRDLKQRGLLDDTLVIWSGEFGRTPMNEARNGSTYLGRDHHPGCFTMCDGRRRGQARPHLRPHLRVRLPGHRRPPCTSTTFRRRSCTCSASTTSASRTDSRVATSA